MKGFMHNSMGSLLNIFGIWMRKAFKWVEAVEGEKKKYYYHKRLNLS